MSARRRKAIARTGRRRLRRPAVPATTTAAPGPRGASAVRPAPATPARVRSGRRGAPGQAVPGGRSQVRIGRTSRPDSDRHHRRIPGCSAPTKSSSPVAARSRRRSSPSGRRSACSSSRSGARRWSDSCSRDEPADPHRRGRRRDADGARRLRSGTRGSHWSPVPDAGPRSTRSSLAPSSAAAHVRARPRLARGAPEPRDHPADAEAAGAHGVVFPTRRQAPLSPSAVKASAGAVEHLLLCPVDDLPEP